jgi:hypothetical protein
MYLKAGDLPSGPLVLSIRDLRMEFWKRVDVLAEVGNGARLGIQACVEKELGKEGPCVQ